MQRRILALALAAVAALAAAILDPRVAGFRQALVHVQGSVSPECAEHLRAAFPARAHQLPRAETWAEHASLAWPGLDGPRGTLRDRVSMELERLGLARPCEVAPRRHAGGEWVHASGGFALVIPDGFELYAGDSWLLARSASGDRALELRSFPSVVSPAAVAARERSLLERQRRIDSSVTEAFDAPLPGRDAFALEITFRARGREVPVRATWLRLDGRVVRALAVWELEAAWQHRDELEASVASLRPAQSDERPVTVDESP
jgi:hypothetical protein